MDLQKRIKKKKNVFKDHTFSGFDLIRFFLNNLDNKEIYQVYDFFHEPDIENLFEVKVDEAKNLLMRYFDFMQDVGRLFGYIQSLQLELAFMEYLRLVKVRKQLVLDTIDAIPFLREMSKQPRR